MSRAPSGGLPRHYRIDVSREPIMFSEFDGNLTDPELDDFVREIDVITARRKPCATICDARNATRLTSAQRSKLSGWIKTNEFVIRTCCSSLAFVITNPLVRGALTAIFWVSPAPVPTLVTADLAEARRWSLERFAERFG